MAALAVAGCASGSSLIGSSSGANLTPAQQDLRQELIQGAACGNDPIAAIKSLADEVADPDLKKRLQSIEELFAAELSKCNEIEDRAVRARSSTAHSSCAR